MTSLKESNGKPKKDANIMRRANESRSVMSRSLKPSSSSSSISLTHNPKSLLLVHDLLLLPLDGQASHRRVYACCTTSCAWHLDLPIEGEVQPIPSSLDEANQGRLSLALHSPRDWWWSRQINGMDFWHAKSEERHIIMTDLDHDLFYIVGKHTLMFNVRSGGLYSIHNYCEDV